MWPRLEKLLSGYTTHHWKLDKVMRITSSVLNLVQNEQTHPPPSGKFDVLVWKVMSVYSYVLYIVRHVKKHMGRLDYIIHRWEYDVAVMNYITVFEFPLLNHMTGLQSNPTSNYRLQQLFSQKIHLTRQ